MLINFGDGLQSFDEAEDRLTEAAERHLDSQQVNRREANEMK